MAMTAKGKHRKAKAHDVELAIAVAAAVPMSAIIALALGCYIGLSGGGVSRSRSCSPRCSPSTP